MDIMDAPPQKAKRRDLSEESMRNVEEQLHETKIDVRMLQEQLLADRAEWAVQTQRLRQSLRQSLHDAAAAPAQKDLVELYALVQDVKNKLREAEQASGEMEGGRGLPDQVGAASKSAVAAEALLSRILRRPNSVSDGGRPESGEWEEDIGVNPLLAIQGIQPGGLANSGLISATAPPATTRESAQFTSEEQLQNDLIVIEQLDKGAAAKVYLVQHRASQQLFALKVLSKRRMMKKKKGVAHVMKELEILSTCSHPFVVGLHASFQVRPKALICISSFCRLFVFVTHHSVQSVTQTEQQLCHLMEYCPRGNFYHLCQAQPEHRLSEVVARFYAAEILSGIEYLHMHGFVYRCGFAIDFPSFFIAFS